ncbi:MAG: diguanylate cyclase [Candidatus Omnitrophica bacterium]|nr:diguanylate cyclase [Candidatus Omnitrophota bacterium]
MEFDSSQRVSILIVENDRNVFDRLKKTLEEDSRFPAAVDDAATFEQACQKLKRGSYDILLVDQELEGRSGLVLLDELQRNNLNLPFVLMTPVWDDRLVREAMKRGVADVLVKDEREFQNLAEKLQRSYQKFRKGWHNSGEVDLVFKDLELSLGRDNEKKSANLAIRDEITHLYNHSYIQERIVQEFSRAVRYQYPISCLLVDIDHFKAINENLGYRIGDSILRECAGLLFENCRLSDLIARYGGGEFAVLLPHINYEGAFDLAKRLLRAFSEHVFLENTEDINFTISIGISSFPEDSMSSRCELLAYASQALCRSKAAGRNRVTMYRDIVPALEGVLPNLKLSEEKIMEFQRRLTEISDYARRAYIEASKALIVALESKDRFTAGHASSCAKYSIEVAESMGMDMDEAEVVEHAALLHDIGKICIPDSILLKPAKLTFQEYEVMKQHPYLGYKILKPIKFLQEEAILVLHHHEWFNGEGYPCRLAGNEIPLGARIIAVIDSYDTMRIAGGRYKKTMLVEDAVNEIINCTGTQFDPEVVNVFIEGLKRRKELRGEDYDRKQLEKIVMKFRAQ